MWLRTPWVAAAFACIATYAALHATGFGHFRSEFLGASLVAGGFGAVAIVGARLAGRPSWLHWLGVFLVNWVFAAYVVSYFAV